MARALLVADSLLESGDLESLRTERYAGWDTAFGSEVLSGSLSLPDLRDRTAATSDPQPRSGRQEELENIVARHVQRAH